jgi:hypothetical protein
MFLDNLLHNLGSIIDCRWRRTLQLEEQVVATSYLLPVAPETFVACMNAESKSSTHSEKYKSLSYRL